MRGLSLVEVTLLLSLAAIVLAIGVPTFEQHLRTSKIAEAPHELQRIHASLAAYYVTPQLTSAGKRLRCLPESAGPAPARPSAKPASTVFSDPSTPGSKTWQAIGYQPDGAIRYRYSLLPTQSGCSTADLKAPPTVTLRAEGDLDADDTLSLFERTIHVKDDSLVADPILVQYDRVE